MNEDVKKKKMWIFGAILTIAGFCAFSFITYKMTDSLVGGLIGGLILTIGATRPIEDPNHVR